MQMLMLNGKSSMGNFGFIKVIFTKFRPFFYSLLGKWKRVTTEWAPFFFVLDIFWVLEKGREGEEEFFLFLFLFGNF